MALLSLFLFATFGHFFFSYTVISAFLIEMISSCYGALKPLSLENLFSTLNNIKERNFELF